MKKSSDIRIRTVPANANPTPRPSTSMKDGRVLRNENNFGQIYKDDDDSNSMYNFVINEEYLRKTCNVVDFLNLQEITLVVDTSIQSVLEIGDLLPNLRSLNLDHSKISSIRDLGVGLRKLTTLSLNDCTLTELDGMGSLTDLSILYLNYNYIYDVTPLAMLENLKVISMNSSYHQELSLKGNRIADLSFADALSSCPCITKLELTGNPISKALPNYREVVASLIPSLHSLDNTLIISTDRNHVSHGMILEAASALTLVREELDDELRMEMLIMNEDVKPVPTSTKSSFSYSNDVHGIQLLPDTGSELTHGNSVALVGGMAAALRRRRTTENVVDEASALELLDNALNTTSTSKTYDIGSSSNNSGSDQPYVLTSSFCEGDVTSQLSNIAQDPSPGYLAMTERVKTAAAKRATTSHGIALSSSKPRVNTAASSNNNTSLDIPRPRTSAPSSPFTYLKPTPVSEGNTSNSSWLNRPRTSGDTSASRGVERYGNNSFPSMVASSRPISASEFSSDGSLGSAPSAPFKVSLSATKKKPSQETPSRKLRNTESSEDEIFPAYNRYGHKSRNREQSKSLYDSEDEGDLSNDDDDEDNGDEEYQGRLANKAIATSGSEGVIPRHRKSIIHRDIVRRVQDGSKKKDGSTFDSEAIGIQHADRHLAMTTSGRMIRSPQPQEEIDSSTGNQLGLLKGLASVSTVGKALRDEKYSKKEERKMIHNKEDNLADDSGKNSFTSSAKAGKSLGFDLKGSLEAIDQWVDDMDSQSESDVDKIAGSNNKNSNSSGGHIVLSHRIGQKKKILSRDTIMSMCVGELDDDSDDNNNNNNNTSYKNESTKSEFVGRKVNSNTNTTNSHHPRNSTTSSSSSSKPDILVISHDRSYDMDVEDMIPLSPKPASPPPPLYQQQQQQQQQYQSNSINTLTSKKSSFRIKGTATISNITHQSKGKNTKKSERTHNSNRSSSNRNAKQVMVFGKRQDKLPEEIASDDGDGYGDLDDILMTDFDMDGLDSPTVRIQDRERIEKENRSRRKFSDVANTNEASFSMNSSNICSQSDFVNNNTSSSRKNDFFGSHAVNEVPIAVSLHPGYHISGNGSGGSRARVKGGVTASRPVKLLALTKTATIHKPVLSHSLTHGTPTPASTSSSLLSSTTPSMLASHTTTQSVNEKKLSKSSNRSSKNSSSSMRGGGLLLSDEELIQLLNLPPKTTPALRTKSSFQEFFFGMSRQRMIMLLEKAYVDVDDSSRDSRIQKRLELLDDVLVI